MVKRMLLLFTCLLLLVGYGCGAVPEPAPTAKSQPEPGPITAGDHPRHIDPAQCAAVSRRVIDQERLTAIHDCTSDRVKLEDGTPADYVVISHGPGMDCESGCIYERKAAMVLRDRIAILPEPFPDTEWIHYSITEKLKVSLPRDLLKLSDRHFVEQDGRWQMILSFREYLKGTVVVNPSRHWETGVVVNATATGALTADQVKTEVWQQFLRQCQPPAGAREFGPDLRPTDDGGWSGPLVWGLGDTFSKIPVLVSPDGLITFPEGCGVE